MRDFNDKVYYDLVYDMKRAIDIFQSIRVVWEDRDILKRISSGIDKITKDFENFKYDKYFTEYIINEIYKLKQKQDGYKQKN